MGVAIKAVTLFFNCAVYFCRVRRKRHIAKGHFAGCDYDQNRDFTGLAQLDKTVTATFKRGRRLRERCVAAVPLSCRVCPPSDDRVSAVSEPLRKG